MAASEGPRGLDGLVTESRRADGDYSALTTLELVELMNREDAAVPLAVGAEAAPLAAALDEIVARLAGGGRLVYAGAGTSGRIAELDAEECEGTFGTSPGQVVTLVAGSDAGSSTEREAAEDDSAAGRRAVETLGVSAADAVVGVSASGRTPYAVGALEAAAEAGALTVALTAARGSRLGEPADPHPALVLGPGPAGGSPPPEAGTAPETGP